MVFSSLIFLFFFLPAALFCYYIVPQKFIRVRNAVLLLFSLFFYFYGEPRLIGMLIFSILMNYLFGLSMRSTYRKPLLILCVIANLSLLGVFKYLNFFISTADSLLGLSIPVTGIVMPIGISFYTFQALSYVIDVYRREVPPQHAPFSLALYVSMFPQLIAGPIVRYHDVNVQLAVRKHSFAQFSEGISRFLFGLSKKVLLSNVFAQIADGVFKYAPSELSAAGAWMGAIGYTLQIYFDFSGYSDMAKCSASSFSKTSTIRTSASRSPSSGAAGISRCPPGSATMCTFRWAATGARPHGTFSICLPYGH